MLIIQIVAAWVTLSVLVATTWHALLAPRRRAKAEFNHWIATHPGLPLEQMPEPILHRYFTH